MLVFANINSPDHSSLSRKRKYQKIPPLSICARGIVLKIDETVTLSKILIIRQVLKGFGYGALLKFLVVAVVPFLKLQIALSQKQISETNCPWLKFADFEACTP